MLAALILTVGSCKVKHPKKVLSETRMENLLYDYHIAKAMSENFSYNENYKRALYIDYVFQKHGTTEEIFDSSMVWYTRHVDVLSKIYEKVNVRLKAEQEKIDRLIALRDKKPMKSASGDSIDVWAEGRVYYLSGYPLNNKMTFILPSDENFEKRDSLSWEVGHRFFGNVIDLVDVAIMSMQMVYTNDSTISVTKKIFKSGKEFIGLKSDSYGDIKEIKGFIYFSKEDTLEKGLLLNDIVLMRYHAKDTIPEIKVDTLEKKEEPKVLDASLSESQEDNSPKLNQRRIERVRPTATTITKDEKQ
ncbi:hypothetical protein EZS27_009595 [termite gut metagenome]|uniref:DUF4296 domain-containing protein n=1 Tax=termite gut metagenome TaxID=433724 RepID=A0A5J4S9T3_9ZZZZ